MKKKVETTQTKPFFTRFLEDQELSKSAGGDQTLKFPSDDDEWWP